MTLFEELRQAVLHQHDQGDFPEWILADILEIADNPERHASREQLVRDLIEQIRGYDPYAGAGCFSASYDIEAIRRSMQLISA